MRKNRRHTFVVVSTVSAAPWSTLSAQQWLLALRPKQLLTATTSWERLLPFGLLCLASRHRHGERTRRVPRESLLDLFWPSSSATLVAAYSVMFS